MSSKPTVSGRNWGAVSIDGSKGVLQLVDGEAKSDGSVSGAPILTVTKDQIQSSNRRGADISLQLKRNPGSAKDSGVVLTDLKLAVPKAAHGYSDSADPPKEIFASIQEKMQGVTGATGAQTNAPKAGANAAAAAVGTDAATDDNFGTLIGSFESITLQQPAGLFDVAFGTKGVKFTDTKKAASVFVLPHEDILKLFYLPTANDKDLAYGVLALKEPTKFFSQTIFRCVVMLLDAATHDKWAVHEGVQDAARLKRALGGDANKFADALTPALEGTMGENLMCVLKATSQLSISGLYSEAHFRSGGKAAQCALPTVAKGNSGFIYMLKTAFVFLSKGAFCIPHEAVTKVRIDDTAAVKTSFDIIIECSLPGAEKPESIKIVNIAYGEMAPFGHYCKSRGLNYIEPVGPDDDSDDDDDESGDGDSDDEDSDDSDDDSFDDDSSDAPKKKKKSSPKKKEKSAKKEKASKSAKKEKKDKSDKKEKKEKKSKESGKRRERDE